MTQTETGVIELEAKEHEGLVAAPGHQEEAGRDSHLSFQKESGPANMLILNI